MYSKAVKAAQCGNIDFAFLYFSSLLDKCPDSKLAEKALFGTAEYYYLIGDYTDASQSFTQFISKYPDSRARLFALVYLLKICQAKEKEDFVKKLRKEIITFKQQSFLFRVFKKYQYRSPLYKHHKAIYYIDKVEFYIDEKLFTKILF